jgi:hypothetical protein
MTTIAKKNDKREQRQTLRRGRHVQLKSGQRKSANMLKHENEFSVRQLLRRNHEAILQASRLGGKEEVAVGETTNRGRATSSRLQE